jgi:glucokinase
MAERWLLADLGGTNTRVALAGPKGVLEGSARSYPNRDFSGLEHVLRAYLKETGTTRVTALCAGVAGPVQGDRAQLTNHDWLIEAEVLRQATGAARVHLINDLQAQGYALDDLPEGAITPLFQPQQTPPRATRLVLNLGTGCNVAVVHSLGGTLFVPPAESGHSTLPHATGRMAELCEYLRVRHPHLPVEAVLSGPGLETVHNFVTGETLTSQEIIPRIAAGHAQETLQLFAETLGAVAGNMALHHLPMGGLYLSGGLAAAIGPHLPTAHFLPAFTARGPYRHIARAIPVSLITAPDFALLGCARYLRDRAHT